MKRALAAAAFALTLTLGTAAATMAAPSNYPTNPNACVGTSSTTANAAFQSVDPDKFRSDQARQEDGQPGRADSVAQIPQCVAAGLDRGTTK
jgi:hypothetical protein